MSSSPVISVVIPVLNEVTTIPETLSALWDMRKQGAEVIVVDGGSQDDTVALAQPLCDRVIISEPGRARQMNAGAALAGGDILLFLHADTRLPARAGQALERFFASDRHWGRFDVHLTGSRPIFRLIEFLMNLRSRLTGIATGDQAMFVRRPVFEALDGFPEIPLMEDVELSARLRRVSRPYCIRFPVMTDSRRWERHGPWRTIRLMWRLRWQYWRGADPRDLARTYRSDVRRVSPGKLKEEP